MNVNVKIIKGGKMPEFKTDGAACADAYARLSKKKFVWLKPVLIPIGCAIELPEETELVIRGRSGNGKKGRFVVIGTIDEDYRGEMSACVWSIFPWIVNNGDRICQLAIRKAPKVNFIQVNELSETARGSNGFGSTGSK